VPSALPSNLPCSLAGTVFWDANQKPHVALPRGDAHGGAYVSVSHTATCLLLSAGPWEQGADVERVVLEGSMAWEVGPATGADTQI
jgi:hypothetical protein